MEGWRGNRQSERGRKKESKIFDQISIQNEKTGGKDLRPNRGGKKNGKKSKKAAYNSVSSHLHAYFTKGNLRSNPMTNAGREGN